jgi:K+ transporter
LVKKRTRTNGETLLGFLILAILALIGVMVFYQQFQFNPAVTAQSALEGSMEQFSSAQLSSLVPLPENFTEMTPLYS